jgi:DNA-binding response OmpR family regulator
LAPSLLREGSDCRRARHLLRPGISGRPRAAWASGCTFDREGRTVRFDGGHLAFTTQEWDLLAIFLSHPNRFLTAREIIRLGWRAGAHEVDQIRIYVRRLRQKLEPPGIPCHLVSQHNRGYCLVVH